MKTVYVCGDSFCTSDPEYGSCWVDLLSHELAPYVDVVNLSSISASNLLISLQVQHALASAADFVIYNCTTVTRGEISLVADSQLDLFEKFQQRHLVSYSIFRPYRSDLSKDQQQKIQNFQKEYFDLDLAIYRDKCIIQNTLNDLANSGTSFLFDQGGFEHPKFGNVSKKYFDQYDQYRSYVNLWDHSDTVDERPYFHIKDARIHKEISDYYKEKILTCL